MKNNEINEILEKIKNIMEDNKQSLYNAAKDLQDGHFDFSPETIVESLDIIFDEISETLKKDYSNELENNPKIITIKEKNFDDTEKLDFNKGHLFVFTINPKLFLLDINELQKKIDSFFLDGINKLKPSGKDKDDFVNNLKDCFDINDYENLNLSIYDKSIPNYLNKVVIKNDENDETYLTINYDIIDKFDNLCYTEVLEEFINMIDIVKFIFLDKAYKLSSPSMERFLVF